MLFCKRRVVKLIQRLSYSQDRWNYYQEYFRTSIKLWENTESERLSDEEMSKDGYEKLWDVPDVKPKVKVFIRFLQLFFTFAI